jgi:hypothetical protein
MRQFGAEREAFLQPPLVTATRSDGTSRRWVIMKKKGVKRA